MSQLITVMAITTLKGDDDTLGKAIHAAMFTAGVQSCTLIVLDDMTEQHRAALVTLLSEEAVEALEWRCSGCGSSSGRYDDGDACESCVTDSFAEGG